MGEQITNAEWEKSHRIILKQPLCCGLLMLSMIYAGILVMASIQHRRKSELIYSGSMR